MDPQTLMMMMAQGGGGPREHPLARAFGGAPMYGGVAIQPSQMFDFSGFGGGPMGQMAAMMLQGVMPGLMGPNFTPGQFAPTQNFADHRVATNYFVQQRRAMERGAEADKETYFRMIRGAGRMSGVEYPAGGEQEQAARRFAGNISQMAPIIGPMMPETFDRISGIRGSATMMAQGMFEGGRYRFDPMSGRIGMSGDSAGQLASDSFNMLYGSGADVSRMKGLGAGRVGKLFDEMTRRGVGPGTFVDEDEQRTAMARELARPGEHQRSPLLQKIRTDMKRAGLRDDDPRAVDKFQAEIEKMSPEAFEAAARSFDSSRVSRSLQKMAGAVAAMRDIFGDMGRPNAPMIELLNGLQSLTQGGMTHLSPDKLEKSVRHTYAIAKSTGLGLEGIMGFAGTAGQMLDQVGMNRALATPIAQQSAAFGFAFGLSGQPRIMGALDKEQASQLDIRLRAQASASPQAVRLAALMRASDEFTREDGGKGFADDTEAYAMSEAIKAGEKEYKYLGARKSIFQSAPQIVNILTRGGMTANEAQQAVSRRPGAASRTVSKYGIQDLVREAQGDLDAQTSFGNVFARSASTSLSGSGISERLQPALARDIGNTLFAEARKLMDEDPTMFSEENLNERNKILAERVKDKLGDRVAGLTPARLTNLVSSAFETGEDFVNTRGSGYEAARSVTGVLQMNSRRTHGLTRRTIDDARGMAQIQAALSGIGQEGLVSRVSDYMQEVGPGGGKLSDFVFSALGGIATPEIANASAALLEKVVGLQTEYEKTGAIRDPRRRQTERDRIKESIKSYGPDVTRALEGKIDELSPAARYAIEEYTEYNLGVMPEAPRLTPEQTALREAQKGYRKAQDDALEGIPEVKAAKEARDSAADEYKSLEEEFEITGDPEARSRMTAAGQRLGQKQRLLGAKITRATPGIQATPAVRRAKEALDRAKENVPGAEGRTRADGETEGVPGRTAAGGVSVSSPRVDVSDAREVRVTASTVTLERAERREDVEERALKEGEEAVPRETRVVGTLTLEGLDRVILAGRTETTGDTRSA